MQERSALKHIELKPVDMMHEQARDELLNHFHWDSFRGSGGD